MTMDYDFTVDWTSQNYQTWSKILAPFVNQPGLKFLEIGSFEGRSAAWFLDNILTHPMSSMICIDTFDGSAEHAGMPQVPELYQRFTKNMERHKDKVIVKRGMSYDVLRAMTPGELDLVYIDGSHDPADVLTDGVLAWPLVRSGGLIIFDDYWWAPAPGRPGPMVAVDGFLASFAARCEVKLKDYQVIIVKL